MRTSGILLHISSLPSPGGIGSLGREAYAFADFLHASGLRVQIRKYGIGIHCNTRAERIAQDGVTCSAEGKSVFFPADTVVYAVGQRSIDEDALALNLCAPEFFMLGDCVTPRNIVSATGAAYTVARDIGTR